MPQFLLNKIKKIVNIKEDESTKNLFSHKKEKPWWRQQLKKLTNKKTRSLNDNSSSSHTTLDWRSLSPDRPPLPFFIPPPNNNSSPTSSNTSLNKNNESNTNSTQQQQQNIEKLDTSSASSSSSSSSPMSNTTLIINSNKSIRNNPTTIDNYQPLCPILEESETMITESTGGSSNMDHPYHQQDNKLSPNNIMHESSSASIAEEDEEEEIIDSSTTTTTSSHRHSPAAIVDQQQQNRNEEKPVIKEEEDAISDSSAASFHPPPPTTQQQDTSKVQKTPSDRYMSDDIVGDEEKCKRKFAKMVLAASKFQATQQKEAATAMTRPSHMALLFNVDGNIDMMRMVRQGKSEYHKFCGNSQYVPPELSVNTEYHGELADIWVLGIFLYRMLVGKYPFSAPNDQQLFKKMLHGQFTMPSELSEDAKDLLKRMLAPDMTRASLDLIIYHPWLQPYRLILLDHYQKPSSSSAPTATVPKSNQATTVSKLDYFNNNHHHTSQQQQQQQQQQQRNFLPPSRNNSVHASSNEKPPLSSTTQKKSKKKNVIQKAILLLIQGPFPPPRKPYRDLSHLGTRESVFARSKTPAAFAVV